MSVSLNKHMIYGFILKNYRCNWREINSIVRGASNGKFGAFIINIRLQPRCIIGYNCSENQDLEIDDLEIYDTEYIIYLGKQLNIELTQIIKDNNYLKEIKLYSPKYYLSKILT
jgi:hypothetical protein